MRVATVFTGVASAAAFAAPANAQAVAKVTPGAALRATLYAGVGVNSAQRGGCNSLTGESHWFKIINTDDAPWVEKCYGGMGTTTDVSIGTAFCGGNNWGFFSGHSANGKRFTNQRFVADSNYYNFRAPKWPDNYFSFSTLHISAAHGNQIC